MKLWVISVYVAVFRPSLDVYALAPVICVKSMLLFGNIANDVAVPSFTHTLIKRTLPEAAVVTGTDSIHRSLELPDELVIVS